MPSFDPGDYVKVEFKDELEPVGEWMWMRIESVDEEKRLIFGVLDNEPLLEHGHNASLGTRLAVSYDKIRGSRGLLIRMSSPIPINNGNLHTTSAQANAQCRGTLSPPRQNPDFISELRVHQWRKSVQVSPSSTTSARISSKFRYRKG
jgi:hypothetical protein